MISKKYMLYSMLGIAILVIAQSSLWSAKYLILQEEDPGVVITEGIGKVENGLEYINLEAIEPSQYMSFENLIKEEPQNLIIITNDQGEREYYVNHSLTNGWAPNSRTPRGTLIESSKEISIPFIDTDFIIDENIVEVPQQQVEVPQQHNEVAHSNAPVEEDGIRYKIIGSAEAGVNLGSQAIIINGQEALNLGELDAFSQESWEDILNGDPVNLAVVTAVNGAINDPNVRRIRHYFVLEDLQNWADGTSENAEGVREQNKRRSRVFSYTHGGEWLQLNDPILSLPIESIRAFRIDDINAQPVAIDPDIDPAHAK